MQTFKDLPVSVEIAMLEIYQEYRDIFPDNSLSNEEKCQLVYQADAIFCQLPNFVWNHFHPEFPIDDDAYCY